MRPTTLPILLLATMLTVSSCAAVSTPRAVVPPGGVVRNGVVPAAPAGEGGAAPAGEGGAPGGEGAVTAYVDARNGYRVSAPGPMSTAADGTASYTGSQERLEIAIRTGSGLDPAALAAADLRALRSTVTGFQLVSGPAATRLGNRTVQKLVYTWTAGTSTVTGKPIQLTTARYYIPKDATKVAVLTYGVTASQYDPQGADDIALSFGWT